VKKKVRSSNVSCDTRTESTEPRVKEALEQRHPLPELLSVTVELEDANDEVLVSCPGVMGPMEGSDPSVAHGTIHRTSDEADSLSEEGSSVGSVAGELSLVI
jgi:hypothetical protein